jgi:hypothetical protein
MPSFDSMNEPFQVSVSSGVLGCAVRQLRMRCAIRPAALGCTTAVAKLFVSSVAGGHWPAAHCLTQLHKSDMSGDRFGHFTYAHYFLNWFGLEGTTGILYASRV